MWVLLTDQVPDKYLDLVLGYLKTVQGGSRTVSPV